MADDEGAVGIDADIAFQSPCAGVGAVDEGCAGVLHTPLRTAVSHDELGLHAQGAHDDEGNCKDALEQ